MVRGLQFIISSLDFPHRNGRQNLEKNSRKFYWIIALLILLIQSQLVSCVGYRPVNDEVSEAIPCVAAIRLSKSCVSGTCVFLRSRLLDGLDTLDWRILWKKRSETDRQKRGCRDEILPERQRHQLWYFHYADTIYGVTMVLAPKESRMFAPHLSNKQRCKTI